MTYKIEIYPEVRDQIRVLPAGLAVALAEAMAMLALTPWNGMPINEQNPDASVRQITLGEAGRVIVTYLILEDQRRVDLLQVIWVG